MTTEQLAALQKKASNTVASHVDPRELLQLLEERAFLLRALESLRTTAELSQTHVDCVIEQVSK